MEIYNIGRPPCLPYTKLLEFFTMLIYTLHLLGNEGNTTLSNFVNKLRIQLYVETLSMVGKKVKSG